MSLSKIRRNVWIIYFTGLAIALLGAFSATLIGNDLTCVIIVEISVPVGLMMTIAGAIYSYIKFRCPHCNKPLLTRGERPNFCPCCGEKLDW